MWVFMRTVEQYNLRLFNRPDIHSFIKSKRLEWFGHAWMRYHAWRAVSQLLKNVLVNKIIKTRPLGQPRSDGLT